MPLILAGSSAACIGWNWGERIPYFCEDCNIMHIFVRTAISQTHKHIGGWRHWPCHLRSAPRGFADFLANAGSTSILDPLKVHKTVSIYTSRLIFANTGSTHIKTDFLAYAVSSTHIMSRQPVPRILASVMIVAVWPISEPPVTAWWFSNWPSSWHRPISASVRDSLPTLERVPGLSCAMSTGSCVVHFLGNNWWKKTKTRETALNF